MSTGQAFALVAVIMPCALVSLVALVAQARATSRDHRAASSRSRVRRATRL